MAAVLGEAFRSESADTGIKVHRLSRLRKGEAETPPFGFTSQENAARGCGIFSHNMQRALKKSDQIKRFPSGSCRSTPVGESRLQCGRYPHRAHRVAESL